MGGFMRNSIMMALFAFTVAGLVMVASPSMAVHKGVGDLTCGNCHTMHSSQGNDNDSAMGGTDGGFILLRAASVTSRAELHLFCLQCHAEDGSQGDDPHAPLNIRAPKVLLSTISFSVTGGGSDFSKIGAGGNFGDDDMGSTFDSAGTYTAAANDDGADSATDALGRGHSLGAASTVKPPGNNVNGLGIGEELGAGLSCTTCHDPHGTDSTTDTINMFRNLKVGSSNKGKNPWTNVASFGNFATSYAGGVSGCKAAGDCDTRGATMGTATGAATNVWPVYIEDARQNSYLMSGPGYDPTGQGGFGTPSGNYVGISLFCAQCHGSWHEMIDESNDNLTAGTPTSDWRRHPVNNILNDTAGTTQSGGGVDIFDQSHFTGGSSAAISMPERLPVSNAAGLYYTSDLVGDTTSDRVFCLSCHFVHGSANNDILRWDYTSAVSAGSQSGNGVPTNVGCQQCHNR